jgi:hypothetical protein
MRRIIHLFILLALVAAPLRAPASATPIRVLLANIGNSNVYCEPYAFKLCFQSVEDRVGASIRSQQPDIIALIEVLPLARCQTAYPAVTEPDPQKVCASSHEVTHQISRLVGPGYSIACDARFAWDCLAVRDSVVHMSEADGFALNGLRTAPALSGCDAGFTINAADVTVSPAGGFRIVLAHPDSGFTSGAAGVECRRAQLQQAFALAGAGNALVLGDLNMDPYRGSGPDVDVWNQHVGTARRFAYHSGIAEHDSPYPTYFMGESSNLLPTGEMLPTIDGPEQAFARTTLDHVASDFLDGSCATLGEAPGTARLDGGSGGGMDHRALTCSLRG